MASSPQPDELDKHIFIKDGGPVRFLLHRSVKQGVDKLTRDIEAYGGEVTEDKENADVLLVDEEADIELIRRRYYSSTDLFRIRMIVEPRGFIRRCIRSGVYKHRVPRKQGMPGLRAGTHGRRARQNFTPEEDEHLAYYIATILPDPSTGGRMGNACYKKLVEMGGFSDYDWVRRHTWQSWRERYKTQKARLDPLIEKYVQKLKDIGHQLGHDPRSLHYRRYDDEEEDEEEGEEGGEGGEKEEEEEEVNEGNSHQGGEQLDAGQPLQKSARGLNANDAANNYLAQHEHELIAFDDHSNPRTERSTRIGRKRRHIQSRTLRGNSIEKSPAKRARVGVAGRRQRPESIVEQGRGRDEQSPTDMNAENSPAESLFGDNEYGGLEEEPDRISDNPLEVENLPQHLASSDAAGPEEPGLGATQRTLVGSPITRDKEISNEVHPATRAQIQERSRQLPSQNVPPSSQVTLVTGYEQTAAVHEVIATTNAHAPRAPPSKGKTAVGTSTGRSARAKAQIITQTTDAPYRNTRARSRSVESQPTTIQEVHKGKGKGKARTMELEPVMEDSGQRFENEGQTITAASSSGLPITGTLDDEIAVENLLHASDGDGLDSDNGEGPPPFQEVDELEESSEENEKNDDELPQYQDIDEPSDSDDAEIHQALSQPAGSHEASEISSSEASDLDLEEDDDRLERLASAALRRVPPGSASTSRGSAATPARPYIQKHVQGPTFPSPGTRAREVVDRINQEKRKLPYTPPAGSRAARAAARNQLRQG